MKWRKPENIDKYQLYFCLSDLQRSTICWVSVTRVTVLLRGQMLCQSYRSITWPDVMLELPFHYVARCYVRVTVPLRGQMLCQSYRSITWPDVMLELPFHYVARCYVRVTVPLRGQMLCSSAPQPFPLPLYTLLRVVFVVIFVPVTRPLFAQTICYHPCVLRAHTISTYCCPLSPKLSVLPAFFSDYLIPYIYQSGGPCSSSSKIHFCS